jgi:hypothetical protein
MRYCWHAMTMLQSRQSRTKQEPSEGAMKMRQLTHLGRVLARAAARCR